MPVGPLRDEPTTRKERYERIGEILLTSQRKRMSTLEVDTANANAQGLFYKRRARRAAGALRAVAAGRRSGGTRR